MIDMSDPEKAIFDSILSGVANAATKTRSAFVKALRTTADSLERGDIVSDEQIEKLNQSLDRARDLLKGTKP